jgi:hypothetical protein
MVHRNYNTAEEEFELIVKAKENSKLNSEEYDDL